MTTLTCTRRLLIPSAGEGKRVGSPPAKELLPDETGEALIEEAFALADMSRAEALVISRESKQALNEYVQSRERKLCLISKTKEWPDTLLQSEAFWFDTNVVYLPDTRFSPRELITQLFVALEQGAETCFAVFDPPELRSWGAIAKFQGRWSICEKPSDIPQSSNPRAWGIFGFRRESGKKLLEAFMRSSALGTWQDIDDEPKVLTLAKFEDLTRPGECEKK